MEECEPYRRRFDEIDRRLVALLNERAACALEIRRLKAGLGLAVYQPDREAAVLANVHAGNQGPLDDAAPTRLFERIIDEARRLEKAPGKHR